MVISQCLKRNPRPSPRPRTSPRQKSRPSPNAGPAEGVSKTSNPNVNKRKKRRVIYRNPHVLARYGHRFFQTQNEQRYKDWKGRFENQTLFVCASGPSLTLDDIHTISELNHPIFVTNNTFFLVPNAAALFFHDPPWWRKYKDDVERIFSGECITPSLVPEQRVLSLHGTDFNAFGNSGAAAISFGIYTKASKIICLGLDCKFDKDGKTHWHGSHVRGLGDAKSLPKWFERFDELALYAKENNVKVINASRDTDLESFECIQLEDLL